MVNDTTEINEFQPDFLFWEMKKPGLTHISPADSAIQDSV